MEWLKILYPQVLDVVREATPEYWPELRRAFSGYLAGPVTPEVYLPLACCQAVGGRPEAAVHVAAAVLAAVIGLRTFDDAADQDRAGRLWEVVGPARAWNYGSAAQLLSFRILSQSPLPLATIHKISRLVTDTYLLVLYGQDRDMSGQTRALEDYWLTIEYKCAYAFAGACAAGAMAGTEDATLVEACGLYGHHLGMATQILNDMDSIWSPAGKTDVRQGKMTLPLLYGLATEHPEREELAALAAASNMAQHAPRIEEILDQMDTRSYLMWAALTERDEALAAIRRCPGADGREVLEAYITAMFDDVGEVLASKNEES